MGRYWNDIIERCSFRLLLSKAEREREMESGRDRERVRERRRRRESERDGGRATASCCFLLRDDDVRLTLGTAAVM